MDAASQGLKYMADPGVRTYDLSELTTRLARLSRVGFYSSWFGIGIGLVALGVSVRALLGLPSGWSLAVTVTGLGFGLFISGISTWSVRHLRRGADTIMVGNGGVCLRYRGGRIVNLAWADPRLSFDLQDGSVLPAEVTRGGLLYTLKMKTGDTPLTKESFLDVLTQAQERGLVARSGRDRVLLMPSSMWLMMYHVRGSPTTWRQDSSAGGAA